MDRSTDREARAQAMAGILVPFPILCAFVPGFGPGTNVAGEAPRGRARRPRADRGGHRHQPAHR